MSAKSYCRLTDRWPSPFRRPSPARRPNSERWEGYPRSRNADRMTKTNKHPALQQNNIYTVIVTWLFQIAQVEHSRHRCSFFGYPTSPKASRRLNEGWHDKILRDEKVWPSSRPAFFVTGERLKSCAASTNLSTHSCGSKKAVGGSRCLASVSGLTRSYLKRAITFW